MSNNVFLINFYCKKTLALLAKPRYPQAIEKQENKRINFSRTHL